MVQTGTSNRSGIWPVVFPDEKLIVKRPSLRHICHGNTDLGELLSYFLYEVGKDAHNQGIDPLAVEVATLYRNQEDVLYAIDHSISVKTLRRSLTRLEQLEYLEASPHRHMYIIFLWKIRQNLLQIQHRDREKPPHHGYPLPPSVFHVSKQEQDLIVSPDGDDLVKVPNDLVKVPNDLVKVPNDLVKVPNECADLTIFYIDPETTPQEASGGTENAPRYNRYNKEIKRDNNREFRGEASAIATPSSSFSPLSASLQENTTSKEVGTHIETTPTIQSVLSGQKVKNARNKVELQGSAPEKPDRDSPPIIETFLALADYYRGYCLAQGGKPNSPYRMALEAAMTFVNRKKTLAEVDAVFAYMKGTDEHFCDDWWPMQTVDLWHVARHFDGMSRKITHRRAYSSVTQAVAQASQGFQTRPMAEVMEMSLEERKLYLSRLRDHMQHQVAL